MVENKAYKPIVEYKLNKLSILFILLWKATTLLIAIYLSYAIIYEKCLMSPNCNIVATTFFAILILSLLEAAGLPINKTIPKFRLS